MGKSVLPWALVLGLLAIPCGPVAAQDQDARAKAAAQLRSMLDEASGLAQSGDFARALARATDALELATKEFGPESAAAVECLGYVGGIRERMGDPSGARSDFERALRVAEKLKGGDSPDMVPVINSLADVARQMGDSKAARPLYERSLAICETRLGPDHPLTARTLNGLALLLHSDGELEEAKSRFERAVAICEKALGADHLMTAMVLANLGSVLHDLGQFDAAKTPLEKALAIREKALGPDHPNTARSLSDLAALLSTIGDLERAKELVERTVCILESTLGPDHPETAGGLEDLGMILWQLGDLKRARTLLERSRSIQSRVLGPRHPDSARSDMKLAMLLHRIGDDSSAEALLKQALPTIESALGPSHPVLAGCLEDLAIVLESRGDDEGARCLLERAVKIDEAALGPEHPKTAATTDSLADVLLQLGRHEEAQSLHERALAVRERVLGPGHPQTAASLVGSALACMEMGDHAGAKKLLQKALDGPLKSLGASHSLAFTASFMLARVLADSGEPEKAKAQFELAWRAQQDLLETLLPALSSRERCEAMRQQSYGLLIFLKGMWDDPVMTWEAALAWKGAAMRASAATLRCGPSASERERALSEELLLTRRRLASLALSTASSVKGEPSTDERYQALRGQMEGLERQLAEARPGVEALAMGSATSDEVRRNIPEGAVLLDVMQVEGRLFAWVARRDGEVTSWYLGLASEVEPLARSFREALQADEQKGWKGAGGELRSWLGGPLDVALEGATALYVSPDGALATIPWGLLPDGDGLLGERVPVVSVNAGASMVGADHAGRRDSDGGLMAVGGVDYAGLDRPFAALPETMGEVDLVSKRFRAMFPEAPCQVSTGKHCDEERFCQESPRVRYVHVATHGFFDLEHLRLAVASETRGLSGKSASPLAAARQQGLDVGGWNPLLLSGLVLAPSEDSDGYLTAEELQDLDLRGVELVVLSACETGCGELAAGEGVLGLSRALAIAGARQFMLSLWKVPDAETAELMDAFYEGLWEKGLPAEEALRRAQLAMLARDREKGVFRPSTWGAWVLTR